MKIKEINEIIQREDLVISEDASRIVRPIVAPRIKITKDPINNDLEYLGSLRLKVEGHQGYSGKDAAPSVGEKNSLEGPKDQVVLRCYQPPGALRSTYGAWCLACCAICPLPTGLTYTHLKTHRTGCSDRKMGLIDKPIH